MGQKQKVYVLTCEGPEWCAVIGIYANKTDADTEAKRLDEARKADSKNVIARLSSFCVSEQEVR